MQNGPWQQLFAGVWKTERNVTPHHKRLNLYTLSQMQPAATRTYPCWRGWRKAAGAAVSVNSLPSLILHKTPSQVFGPEEAGQRTARSKWSVWSKLRHLWTRLTSKGSGFRPRRMYANELQVTKKHNVPSIWWTSVPILNSCTSKAMLVFLTTTKYWHVSTFGVACPCSQGLVQLPKRTEHGVEEAVGLRVLKSVSTQRM